MIVFENHRKALRYIRLEPEGDAHTLWTSHCPECKRAILSLEGSLHSEVLLWPKSEPAARPVSEDVPAHIAQMYREASLVLPISPRASASLSRLCLEAVLTEAGGAAAFHIQGKIEQVRDNVPAYVWQWLHAVRRVAKYGAHYKVGEEEGGEEEVVLDVSPEEAGQLLDALDQVFDHYYVKPAQAARFMAHLDGKESRTKR